MSGSEADQSEDGFFGLAEALGAFVHGPLGKQPSDRTLAKAAGVSPDTIGNWLRGRRFPQEIGGLLAVVAEVREAAATRGIAVPPGTPDGLLDDDRWRAAHQAEARRRAEAVSDGVRGAQAATVLAGPGAGLRAGQADPRRLGVHAAISVPGGPDDVPPLYVPRDLDAGESGIRAKVAAAAARGGFVLLVGGSSVGKTRTAVEAVKAVLPDWWLVHPGRA
jgi:transcriptional regulator with XRE-family HTH domain